MSALLHIEVVALEDGRLVTDSRRVAQHFGKRHRDVLRAIRSLTCSKGFNERNFALVEYLDDKGQRRPMVTMTKDGFVFLAMGFTGQQASAIKEAYIEAFNRMAEQLQRRDMSLWGQMQGLIAREAESRVRASFGSRLMLERRREVPRLREQRHALECQIQPMLPLNWAAGL